MLGRGGGLRELAELLNRSATIPLDLSAEKRPLEQEVSRARVWWFLCCVCCLGVASVLLRQLALSAHNMHACIAAPLQEWVRKVHKVVPRNKSKTRRAPAGDERVELSTLTTLLESAGGMAANDVSEVGDLGDIVAAAEEWITRVRVCIIGLARSSVQARRAI